MNWNCHNQIRYLRTFVLIFVCKFFVYVCCCFFLSFLCINLDEEKLFNRFLNRLFTFAPCVDIWQSWTFRYCVQTKLKRNKVQWSVQFGRYSWKANIIDFQPWNLVTNHHSKNCELKRNQNTFHEILLFPPLNLRVRRKMGAEVMSSQILLFTKSQQ